MTAHVAALTRDPLRNKARDEKTKHKPYSDYKPSGVEWLGDVPAHWEVQRLRYMTEMRVSNVDKHTKEYELPVRLCNYVDVYNHEHITEEVAFMQATATFAEINRFRLEIDDVLITKDSETWDDIGVPALVEHVADDLICGYHLAQLRPVKSLLNGEFLLRALQSPVVSCQFHVEAKGVTRYGLTQNSIESAHLPLPPLAEQRAIAAFLDRETAKIDALVSKKERLIELFQEKRTALISRAVTKGLDPNVPMKDSGIEWLGDVPEHWEVAAAKRLFSIQLGKMLQNTPESPADAEVSYLKAQNIQWFQVVTEDIPTMWASQYEKSKFGIEQGDLLVCEGGEGGRCAILRKQIDNCIIQNALHRVRPRGQSLNTFLQYVMSAVNAAGWFDVLNEKATIAHFTKEKFDALAIPSPPPAEQRAIADYLDRETEKLDNLVATVHEAIELLREKRTALISAAVTGRIDVREEAGCI